MKKDFMIALEDFIVKPYVRMTQRSKYVNKYAIAYRNNQAAFKLLVQNEMQLREIERIPVHVPFSIVINFFQPVLHKCDLDNQVKAVLDACQGIVFPNDYWCDGITANRFQITETDTSKPGVDMLFIYEINKENIND